MHDSVLMRKAKRIGRLPCNPDNGGFVQTLLTFDDVFERCTFHQLHGKVGQASFFADVENGNDVGMREDAGGLGLTHQAGVQLCHMGGIGEVAKADGLDGNVAANHRVLGFVNDAHGAPAKFFDDFIPAEFLKHGQIV